MNLFLEISPSFDQIWDVAKWLLLTVVWPVGRWILDRVTGKRQRRLDAIDELLERTSAQAITIADLLQRITALQHTEAELRAEISQLRAELASFRQNTTSAS